MIQAETQIPPTTSGKSQTTNQKTSIHGKSNQNIRGGGQAPGSKGYLADFFTALVSAVKMILPSGSQECARGKHFPGEIE
ncbi:hypothetical protein VP01_1311g5 [Puccinia sorghi]|uniref:Uncharacterized protein n=1 Tax=Puccinia sorghi TaxID=27349 RepID=A0A0L6VN40_9BASI|nr:hypothetical protein VP01_1311g5 [Puccinia sorghi]